MQMYFLAPCMLSYKSKLVSDLLKGTVRLRKIEKSLEDFWREKTSSPM